MRTFVGFLGAAALAAFWQPADAQSAAASPQGPPAAAAAPSASPAAAGAPAGPAARSTLRALQQVCTPLLEGQSLKAVAKSAGLKQKHGQWVLPVSGEQTVSFSPPDAHNPHVCSASIPYSPGWGPSIQAAVDRWARSQAPPLRPDKVKAVSTVGSHQVVTSSWNGETAKGVEGVVLDERKPLPGAQASAGPDRATLLVSITPS